MADGLKDLGGRQLSADEIASEASRQRAANEAMEAINLTKETLHNVTVGNAEERRKAAIEAGKLDRAALAPKSAVKSRWSWLTGK